MIIWGSNSHFLNILFVMSRVDSVSSLVLPPGKLGLELEASEKNGNGLKVRGWHSPVFRLASLSSGSIIKCIDGVSVEQMNFNEAVSLLRDSKRRLIEYYQPASIRIDEKFVERTYFHGEYNDMRRESLDPETPSSLNISVGNVPYIADNNSTDKENLLPVNNTTSSPLKSPLVDRGISESIAASFFRKTAIFDRGYTPVPLQLLNSNTMNSQISLRLATEVRCQTESKPIPKTVKRNEDMSYVVDILAPDKSALLLDITNTVRNKPALEDTHGDCLQYNAQDFKGMKDDHIQKIRFLQAEQRNSDAKIMLLKFQIGKMKYNELQSSVRKHIDPAIVGCAESVNAALDPIEADNDEVNFVSLNSNVASSELVDTAVVGSCEVGSVATNVPRIHQHDTGSTISNDREALLLHRRKFAVVLANIISGHHDLSPKVKGSHEALTAGDSPTNTATQCTLLNDRSHTSQDELQHELFVQKRIVHRLKVQLRANLEAQITMHERCSRLQIETSVVQPTLDDMKMPSCNPDCNEMNGLLSNHAENSLNWDCIIDECSIFSQHDTSNDSVVMSCVIPTPHALITDEHQECDEEKEIGSSLADILSTIEKPDAADCTKASPSLSEHCHEESFSEVKQAWTSWKIKDPNLVEMSLSPASFKNHIRQLRGANTLIREDVNRFRETLKRLAQ